MDICPAGRHEPSTLPPHTELRKEHRHRHIVSGNDNLDFVEQTNNSTRSLSWKQLHLPNFIETVTFRTY